MKKIIFLLLVCVFSTSLAIDEVDTAEQRRQEIKEGVEKVNVLLGASAYSQKNDGAKTITVRCRNISEKGLYLYLFEPDAILGESTVFQLPVDNYTDSLFKMGDKLILSCIVESISRWCFVYS